MTQRYLIRELTKCAHCGQQHETHAVSLDEGGLLLAAKKTRCTLDAGRTVLEATQRYERPDVAAIVRNAEALFA
jgi:recombinational DNA repair protein (RecF pathway)